ncbi:hypothetical protein DERF_003931 [Dermatophagoides farinae]|uniref:Uncharacterized protein n=1 Tax=Dermatophagoides farinae TaxID=6954 RepID=A0A922LCS8_DERFA|nr:hypothetical protein DERF_003931 [Dermatophagoides farinae]
MIFLAAKPSRLSSLICLHHHYLVYGLIFKFHHHESGKNLICSLLKWILCMMISLELILVELNITTTTTTTIK